MRRRPPIPYDPRTFNQKLGIAFQSRVPLLIGLLTLVAVPLLLALQLGAEGDPAWLWTLLPIAAAVVAWRLRSAFKLSGWVLAATVILAFVREARLYRGAFGLLPPRAASATADAHAIVIGTFGFAALCAVAGAAAWVVRAAVADRTRPDALAALRSPLRVVFAGAGTLDVLESVVAGAAGVLASLVLSPAQTPAGLLGTACAAAVGAYASARFGIAGVLAYAGGMAFISVFAAGMYDVHSRLNTLAAPVLFVAASAALLAWFDMGFIALTYVGRQRRFEAEQADRAAATGIVPE
ncbi:MAG: hypothetical protein KGM44_12505 [bacterium]|nr:hypothetical protein [bacterium]